MSRNKTQTRAWLIILGVLLGATALFYFSFHYRRNHWPSGMTRRLADLKAKGVPVSLAECDRRYRALGSTPEAVQHYQQGFAAMSQQPLPLRPRNQQEFHLRPLLPRFSDMASPAQRAEVASCLQSNRVALQLLHEGMRFDRCLFPQDLTNGFSTLLPHLPKSGHAAHLLLLESLDHQYRGESEQAGQSLLAAFHLANMLSDEPTLVGVITRDRIWAWACLAFGECLSIGQLSAPDMKLIDERLKDAFRADQRSLHEVLDYERSTTLAVFQGSDKEICEFLQMSTGPLPRLNIEVLRGAGYLQRDAGFYLEQLDGIQAAITNATAQDTLDALADVDDEVDANRNLLTVNKKRVNIISCMILPGTIRGVRRHIWVQSYVEAARTALAVERFRQEMGRMPGCLQELVPRYLASVSEIPYSREPLKLQTTPRGYVISGGRSIEVNGTTAEATAGAEKEGVEFRVERRTVSRF